MNNNDEALAELAEREREHKRAKSEYAQMQEILEGSELQLKKKLSKTVYLRLMQVLYF
jgi:hypothetical protein